MSDAQLKEIRRNIWSAVVVIICVVFIFAQWIMIEVETDMKRVCSAEKTQDYNFQK